MCRVPQILFVVITCLSLALNVSAEVFRIGADGDYGSLQDAVEAAKTMPGSHDFRVQRGRYTTPTRLEGSIDDATWRITGGYGPTFQRWDRTLVAGGTVFDGLRKHRVLLIQRSLGTTVIENLTMESGFVDVDDPLRGSGGAGLRVSLKGAAGLVLQNVVFRRNRAIDDIDSALGGGLLAVLEDNSSLEMRECVIEDNIIESVGSSSAVGGGVFLHLDDESTARVEDCRLEDNAAIVRDNQATAGGLYLTTYGRAHAHISRVEMRDNLAFAGADGVTSRAAASFTSYSNPGVELERLRVVGNRSLSEGVPVTHDMALLALASGQGRLAMRNSLVARNGGRGLVAEALDGHSQVRLSNLTVAHNQWRGLALRADGDLSFWNSIVFGHEEDLEFWPGGVAASGGNLIGVDPHFLDLVDFDIPLSSPATDHGSLAAPNLGDHDLDGDTRVYGASVDAGAQEAKSMGNTALPCTISGLGATGAPVCLCLREPGHQELRCGVRVPDFFLDLSLGELAHDGSVPMWTSLLPRRDLSVVRLTALGFEAKASKLERGVSVRSGGKAYPAQIGVFKDDAVVRFLIQYAEPSKQGSTVMTEFEVEVPILGEGESGSLKGHPWP